jgi:predicted esterase
VTPAAPTVLLVLHGYDSDAKHAEEIARELDPDAELHWVIPEGPLHVATGLRAWFEVDEPDSITAAADTVRSVVAGVTESGVDASQIAVLGSSQGAAVAFAALAVSSAQRVGTLMSMNGFVVELPADEYDWSTLGESRVLLQHGQRDDVVPSFFSDDLATTMRAAHVDVTHQTFAMGHERTDESMAAARAWLSGS